MNRLKKFYWFNLKHRCPRCQGELEQVGFKKIITYYRCKDEGCGFGWGNSS